MVCALTQVGEAKQLIYAHRCSLMSITSLITVRSVRVSSHVRPQKSRHNGLKFVKVCRSAAQYGIPRAGHTAQQKYVVSEFLELDMGSRPLDCEVYANSLLAS